MLGIANYLNNYKILFAVNEAMHLKEYGGLELKLHRFFVLALDGCK